MVPLVLLVHPDPPWSTFSPKFHKVWIRMDQSEPGGPQGPQPPLVDQECSGPPWTPLRHFPDDYENSSQPPTTPALPVNCTLSSPLSLILPSAQRCSSSAASLCFSYLWFSVASLRFHPSFCFASLSISYGWQHLCLAPTRATLRLSSPARTLDLVYPSYYPPFGIVLLCIYSYLPFPQLASHCKVAALAPHGCLGRILSYTLSLYCTASSIEVNPLRSSNYLPPAYVCAILIGPTQKIFWYFCLWFQFSGYFPFLPVDDWFHFVTWQRLWQGFSCWFLPMCLFDFLSCPC